MSVRGDNGQMVSLASRLPFWVTRRVKTSKGSTVDVLILKDGTMVIGLLVNGLDVFTKVDGVLNRISGNLKDAVNTLPSGFFVQAIFENGLDYKDIIEQYQKVLVLEPCRAPISAILLTCRPARWLRPAASSWGPPLPTSRPQSPMPAECRRSQVAR